MELKILDLVNQYYRAKSYSPLDEHFFIKDSNKKELQKVSHEIFQKLLILLPTAEKQANILKTARKLSSIQTEISKIEKHIYSNRVSSVETLEKLDNFYQVIYELNEEDKFKSLLKKEESKSFEFKSSIKTPYPDFPPNELDKQRKQI